MRSSFVRCGLFALFVALASSAVHAQEDAAAQEAAPQEAGQEAAQSVDPSGAWRWDREFNGQTMDFELKLRWDGEKLTGDYTSFDETTKIEDAKLDKDRVTFTVPREMNGNEFNVDFDGKLTGDRLEGTIGVDFGGNAREFDWVAERSVTIDDVLGEWLITIDTPRGEMESTIEFTKQGEELRAKLSNDFGSYEAENAQVKDNQATFELSGGQGDRTFDFVYKLKPRGNKLTGVTEFDFGGREGEWTFEGKRVPAEEEAAPSEADEGEGETEAGPEDEGPTRERPPLESADE